ncbi:efflux RND transporter periplasmic adaptor subunit [Microbulbifer sp. ANSA003]|uniref:efflux RND transporter periplasmic adaptor subunit n=1 Tax=Microbulbifer sp. ANSA003 TaxID=3243360 RepID=UPI00404292AE
MDKKIRKKKSRKPVWILAGVLGIGYAFYIMLEASADAVELDKSKLTVSRAFIGEFRDFVPLRGVVRPQETVYLDALEGGNVKEVLVQDGAYVEKGQPLLAFSNTPLILNTMARDTAIVEQSNQLRTTQLNLDQETLALREAILDTDYRITQLEADIKRIKPLLSDGKVAKSHYEDAVYELEYSRDKLVLQKEKLTLHKKLSAIQAEQISQSIELLEQNRQELKQAKESLVVRAPVGGYLTGFEITVGESKVSGERLGQIDVLGRQSSNYKIVAEVDEFYLSKVKKGQSASARINNQAYPLIVEKIYTQVRNNKFTVDLTFEQSAPEGVSNGQSIALELTFQQKADVLLLERGSFFEDTGGNWAFVIDESGEYATKKPLTIGAVNTQYIEVKDGLTTGEQVIISKYTNLSNRQRINFKL